MGFGIRVVFGMRGGGMCTDMGVSIDISVSMEVGVSVDMSVVTGVDVYTSLGMDVGNIFCVVFSITVGFGYKIGSSCDH